jgi:hypothetical protein
VQPGAIRRQFRDLALQNFARSRIFVADVDVDLGRFDNLRADQHALDKAVRIGLEIIAILERAGLALVAVDRHQPRPGLAEHRAPFSPGRKARAAETAQGRVVERLQQIFLFHFAGAQALQQRIAAAGDIGVVIDIVGQVRMGIAALGGCKHAGNAGVIDKVVTDLGRGRGVAAADAGRTHHTNAGAGTVLQLMQQVFRAQHRAGERIADPNGQRRDIGFTLLHHIEMRVEGRGLEHLRKCQLHLLGKGCEVGCGNLLVGILDEMQMLDQEVATPRPVTEQNGNFLGGLGVDLAALGSRLGPLSPLAGMFERADLLRIMTHWNVSFSGVSGFSRALAT